MAVGLIPACLFCFHFSVWGAQRLFPGQMMRSLILRLETVDQRMHEMVE
uniref:Uncharacterized protein n=1 Tax=Anguilla anguilla TaxID=7936 RepID=A0A0E9WG09_ANGAN